MDIYKLTIKKDADIEKFFLVPQDKHIQTYHERKDGSLEKINMLNYAWKEVSNVEFFTIHDENAHSILEKIVEADKTFGTNDYPRKDR
jgi:hypothetical protein